jgi:hypothetical protein
VPDILEWQAAYNAYQKRNLEASFSNFEEILNLSRA